MDRRHLLRQLSLATALVTLGAVGRSVTAIDIDDFTSGTGRASNGAIWRGFTDRVMGGVSTVRLAPDTIEQRRCLRLTGEVSLANDGGFVQMALDLDPTGRSIDASQFRGLRLSVFGNDRTYALHLRTAATRLPWQLYVARFLAPPRWTDISIPFDAFAGEQVGGPVDSTRLRRIAVVGRDSAFTADIAVAYLGFDD